MHKDQEAERTLAQPVEAPATVPSRPLPPLPEPIEQLPPDPILEAADKRWEEFEAADYEGQITLFLETLDEGTLLDAEMAFEMLNQIYQGSVERDERDRFDTLVATLRQRMPEVYSGDSRYYLGWLITNAVVAGRGDDVASLVMEMATATDVDISAFNDVLDQLAYHDQPVALLAQVMRAAWPAVRDEVGIFEWALDEFAARATDYEVFAYVESIAAPDLADPELRRRVEFFLEVEPQRFTRYMEHLTGQAAVDWTTVDFELERPILRPRRRASQKREVEPEQNEGKANLFYLTVEFLHYLRHEEGVPYPRGELSREQIERYLVQRYEGKLESRHAESGPSRRRNAPKFKPPSPVNALCPDRATLDRYFGTLLHFLNLQRYKVAATMELIPAWLRFLESQGLIDERDRADSRDNLRPLANDLLKLWQNYSSDPALHARMERRLAGEAGK